MKWDLCKKAYLGNTNVKLYQSTHNIVQRGSEEYIERQHYKDGPNYRKAGVIQVTGIDNYQAFADDVNDQEVVNQGCKYVADKYHGKHQDIGGE